MNGYCHYLAISIVSLLRNSVRFPSTTYFPFLYQRPMLLNCMARAVLLLKCPLQRKKNSNKLSLYLTQYQNYEPYNYFFLKKILLFKEKEI